MMEKEARKFEAERVTKIARGDFIGEYSDQEYIAAAERQEMREKPDGELLVKKDEFVRDVSNPDYVDKLKTLSDLYDLGEFRDEDAVNEMLEDAVTAKYFKDMIKYRQEHGLTVPDELRQYLDE